jgi:hypothetical protein
MHDSAGFQYSDDLKVYLSRHLLFPKKATRRQLHC